MELEQILTGLIAVGCVPLISFAMEKIKEEFEPSPKTTRRISYLVALVIPSIVYGLLALTKMEYEWTAHLMAVIGAWTGSQVLHGETKLKTGKEVKEAKRLDDFHRMPLAGGGGGDMTGEEYGE